MNDGLNVNYNGRISYSDLRQLVFNYYKQNKNIDLASISIGYLQEKLTGSENTQPFFSMKNEYGETRFDVPKGDLQTLLELFLAEKNYELLDVKYGSDVEFTYKENKDIKEKLKNEDKKVELDIDYNGRISYSDLRQIIFDYYKQNKGVELTSTSIGYLQEKLTGSNGYNGGPFFVIKNELGETRFDIPKEDIEKIFKSYLASKDYELTELNYGSNIDFKYRVKEKTSNQKQQSDGMNEEDFRKEFFSAENTSYKDPFVEYMKQKEQQDEIEKFRRQNQIDKAPIINELRGNDFEEASKNAEKETIDKFKKFTILQRERAVSREQRARNRSALVAGLCTLGACVAAYFNNIDSNQTIRQLMDSIYSFESLGQYASNLGPLTTVLAAGAGAFIARYFRHSRRYREAQQEFIDLNEAYANQNSNELGGDTDVRTR